jgi:mono/diheme cytochrome c family protein
MSIVTTQDRAACQGFALAKSEDGRVFAPHVLVFSGEAEVSSGYGGGAGREAEVFHVPIVDEDSGKSSAESKTLRVGLDRPTGTHHCALPRAATVGKAGLYVTCLGENRVELFDADVANPHDVQLKTWAVPAGPTGIALDEDHGRAVVWSQFAHALTTLAIGGDGAAPGPIALSSLTIEREKPNAKLDRGRIIFHATTDRRISSDGRACASCHPEGRDDTLVWSSPKGPRQTPMLAGRLEGAAPYGWNGDASSVSLHLVQTVKRLGGTGLDGEDKDALIAYVSSMRPPPAPKSTPEKNEAALRGSAIFRSEQTGCADCHGATGDLPDGAKHNVKSRNATDLATKFDTPSLRFIGGSAPYFHDGRYPDLKTLLVKSDGKMGHTKHLSPGEIDDLVTYLETL